ncbi:MAG: hypothetical protein ACK56I_11945, partial [bacterium]
MLAIETQRGLRRMDVRCLRPEGGGSTSHSSLFPDYVSYSQTCRAMAKPRAFLTLSIVIRSKICWKNPATIIR